MKSQPGLLLKVHHVTYFLPASTEAVVRLISLWNPQELMIKPFVRPSAPSVDLGNEQSSAYCIITYSGGGGDKRAMALLTCEHSGNEFGLRFETDILNYP